MLWFARACGGVNLYRSLLTGAPMCLRTSSAPVDTNPTEPPPPLPLARYRPPLPIRTPAPWTRLMQACWAHDPRDRPDFNEVVAKLESIIASHPRADFPADVVNFACYANPGEVVTRV